VREAAMNFDERGFMAISCYQVSYLKDIRGARVGTADDCAANAKFDAHKPINRTYSFMPFILSSPVFLPSTP
jgi:hypothetical protein